MGERYTWPEILSHILSGQDLSISQSSWAMEQMMEGVASDAQVSAFLVALRSKGETVDELIGFRESVLSHAVKLPTTSQALDICGTGGDRHNTVNISTASAIIASSLDIPVIKHGNRAATSSSGSSDVLSELGINLDISANQVAEVLDKTGITFAFAAAFHPGFRHVAHVRKEIGVPTFFNILGPLCNPARPEASAVGVSQLDKVPLICGVFQVRGATALVFRGEDGLDELSTTGHSKLWEISRGRVFEHDLNPTDLGIKRAEIEELRGGDPKHNAQVLRNVLSGDTGPVRDIILLNAAAGIVAYNLSLDPTLSSQPILDRLREGVNSAAKAVDSGRAYKKLEKWTEVTQSYS